MPKTSTTTVSWAYECKYFLFTILRYSKVTTILIIRPDPLLLLRLTLYNWRCAFMLNHWRCICKQNTALWYTVKANSSVKATFAQIFPFTSRIFASRLVGMHIYRSNTSEIQGYEAQWSIPIHIVLSLSKYGPVIRSIKSICLWVQ